MANVTFQVPVPPPNFTTIPTEFEHGSYIVGHDQFPLASFPQANVFQRELTKSDDLLLGILSVILIAILSDLVFTILLRTTSKTLSPSGLFTAFMVDEATHFRNVLRTARRLMKPTLRPTATPPTAQSPPQPTSNTHAPLPASPSNKSLAPALLSMLVLTILLALFIADVIVIVVTQPRTLTSGKHAYNLRAVHPASTNIGLANYVRRLALERPCVAPVMTNGSNTQSRRFHLNVCLGFSRSITLAARTDAGADVAPRVNVTSLFHSGGVDHNVSFPSGWLSISIRVQLMADGELEGVRYLLFDSADDDAMSQARYLHNIFITRAKQHSCLRNYDEAWCRTRAKRITSPSSQRMFERTIVAWHGRNNQRKVKARGLESLFDEDLPRAYRSLDRGTHVLITSAAVRETVGPGAYVNTRSDDDEDGIAGLLEEDSRAAGVALLALLTVATMTCLLAMRVWLKPTTLSELAAQGFENSDELPLSTTNGSVLGTSPEPPSDPPSLLSLGPQSAALSCVQCGLVQRPRWIQQAQRDEGESEAQSREAASFLAG